MKKNINQVSQLGQDQFVLETLKYKTNGYFVEFGAMDGVYCSNTYLLEKDYGWDGILIEPNPELWEKGTKNRACKFLNACVSNKEETVDFLITDDPVYSSISSYSQNDYNAFQRQSGTMVELPAYTLRHVLDTLSDRKHIDYMSIDTEGNEYEILERYFRDNMDKRYTIDIFTVEHNFNPNRDRIRNLMLSQDYKLVHEDISRWDWYFVSRRIINS